MEEKKPRGRGVERGPFYKCARHGIKEETGTKSTQSTRREGRRAIATASEEPAAQSKKRKERSGVGWLNKQKRKKVLNGK